VVLTRQEVQKLLAAIPIGTYQMMVRLLYGTGMRLMECVRLRIKDMLFQENQLVIRNGKRFKDRITMMPASLKAELNHHLERVRMLHEQDLAGGYGETWLPFALSRKYPQ